jgi:hypothetical protein
MDTANPILGNPLLLIAILLFLAILPRALRQKEKTELDKAVERFEKEELKTALAEKSGEDKNNQKKPIALRDGSLAYPRGGLRASQQTGESGGIPPFPAREEDNEERVKIVKPGVPISHFETAEPPPKKKVKLIKQEFSIAPDENRKSPKKTRSEPAKESQEKTPAKKPETTQSEDFPAPPISDSEESKGNWIEAEIPGLTIEPPTPEKAEDIPVFNAFPKEKYRTEAEEPQESPENEKQDTKVKNIAPETEEKEDSKSKEQAAAKKDSPELEVKISESESKEVEIKAPVASHKSIAKKETEAPEEEASSSPEMEKVKPFLLDLRYLAPEESKTEHPDSQKEMSGHMVDVTIARLNALQADLESQLTSIPGKLIPKEILANENMRKDRIEDSLPDLERMVNESSNQKEISVEELDSFLFTATQRKNKE